MTTHSTHFHSGASAKSGFLHGTLSFPPVVNSSELDITSASDTPLRLGENPAYQPKDCYPSKQTRSTSALELVTRVHCHSRETTPMARAVLWLGSSAAFVFSRTATTRNDWRRRGYKVRGIKHIDPTCWPNSGLTASFMDNWDCHVCSSETPTDYGVLLRMFQRTIFLFYLFWY